jgi:apolipoprotein N-acyltransferase
MILRQIFLCLFSSLLLVLSFPKFNLEYLAWIGFVPLLSAIAAQTKRKAFWLSYFCGLVFFLSVLYWLVHVTLTGLIILSFYLAFYFAFFGYFFTGFSKRLPNSGILLIILLSSIWVILEYIRCQFISGFPWALLGYSQYLNIKLIQFADITGSLGPSFLVICVNLCIFRIIKSALSGDRHQIFKFILILVLTFGIVYSYGFYSVNKYSPKGDKTIKACLIQGNIPQELKWENDYSFDIKQIYLDLSRECLSDDPDIIIWPETSLPDYLIDTDMDSISPLIDINNQIKKPILLGAVLQQKNQYFNSAVLVPEDLSYIKFYKKIHLVPFGEYLPLRGVLPFLVKFVPIEDFTAGRSSTIFTIKNKQNESVSFGVLICFEDTISELSRQLRLRGADFLVNITNDAWFKKTSSPFQHLQSSVFRAIENRVYVLRAANTGVTCIIDDLGKVVNKVSGTKKDDIFVRGFISGDIGSQKVISFYTRFGDVFILFCGLYILLFAVYIKKSL